MRTRFACAESSCVCVCVCVHTILYTPPLCIFPHASVPHPTYFVLAPPLPSPPSHSFTPLFQVMERNREIFRHYRHEQKMLEKQGGEVVDELT